MKSRRSAGRLGNSIGWMLVFLVVFLLQARPALAEVGLAVVLDLPPSAKVGDRGLTGNLTITNANTAPQTAASNIVVDISLIPSCEPKTASGDCSTESGDPGVLAIDSPAVGRAGSACAGIAFKVAVSDPATGEVTFDPRGGSITLAPAAGQTSGEECVVDFTFNVVALPVRDSASGGEVRTTAHAGAYVLDASGAVSGSGTWKAWEIFD